MYATHVQLEQQYREKMCTGKRGLEEEKERLKRREVEMEANLFTQRQTLLKEMEVLKLREREIKRQSELNKRYLTTLFTSPIVQVM